MFTNLFCSVLSACASAGNFSVQLTSLNASANVTVTLSATGNTVGMSPDEMAANAITQFQTQLIQYGCIYNGEPVLSQDVPAATWRVLNTDHVITFFSECQFRIKLYSNTTGAQIVTGHEPMLITLADFNTYANIMKVGGANLTDEEKLLLITTASGLVTSYLNNQLVLAGYVKTETGCYQKSFFLNQGLPVQSFDPPKIAPPGMYFMWWYVVLPWVRWNLNPETGELYYQPSQNLLNWPEPSSLGYQIKISYVAGNLNLPAQVLIAMTMLIKSIVNDMGGAKSLKTGSFQVVMRDRTVIQEALSILDEFVL